HRSARQGHRPGGSGARRGRLGRCGAGYARLEVAAQDHSGQDQGAIFRCRARQTIRRHSLRAAVDGCGQELGLSGALGETIMAKGKTYGVGIMGAGNISSAYLRVAPQFKGLEVRGVADIIPAAAKKRSEEFGVHAMTPDEMLKNSEIDVIVN